jgi:hypothetical protein
MKALGSPLSENTNLLGIPMIRGKTLNSGTNLDAPRLL